MKFAALLLGASLLLPVFAVAQEAAPAPEAPAQEANFSRFAKMRKAPRLPECKNADCACMKAFSERPKMERPAKKFSEMTEEERAAFRETMKAQREAFTKKIEEAKAACKCEDCFCKKGPKNMDRKPRGKGPRGPRPEMKGPKGPRGKRGPRPAAPAPEAPAAE